VRECLTVAVEKLQSVMYAIVCLFSCRLLGMKIILQQVLK